MRTTGIIAAAAGLALAAGVAAPALAVEEGKAELSVLHGIPDLTVDVYVNGELTLDDFAPSDLAGPLTLDPGTYSVAITASDAADDSSPVLGPIDLPLEADMSYTAVAHLTAEGDPTASLFTNDLAPTAAGEGRLTVRHTAAAPAVDILAGDAVLFSNLANPDEVMGDVPADTYSAAVAATGTTDPVVGPADVMIEDGVNTIVYAWGSLEDGNLALAVQTVTVGSDAPGGVPTGTGGLLGEQESSTLPLAAAGLALLVAMGIGGAAVARNRR